MKEKAPKFAKTIFVMSQPQRDILKKYMMELKEEIFARNVL